MRIILTTISFLFLVLVAKSQNIVFEKITTREGLSQNDVTAIYQDKQGFLWIGTFDGLNRYDGYNFKTYRVNPEGESGVHSNIIFNISEDEDGNLWLGASDEGLCRFDVKTETYEVFKNTDENPNFLQSNQIVCAKPASNGKVWVANNLGIDVLIPTKDGYRSEVFKIDDIPEDGIYGITSINEDIYGRIWFATRNGIYVYSENNGLEKLSGPSESANIKDIVLHNGDVYVATSGGVLRYSFNSEDLNDFTVKQVSNINSDCLLVNKTGNLFMGTWQGLYIVSSEQMEDEKLAEPLHFTEGWETNSLSKNVIRSLYEDRSGIIWIGTNGGGINKYNPRQKKFRHFNKTRIEGSLSYNKIRSIHQSKSGNIWIGTEGGGINLLTKDKHRNYESGWEWLDVNESGQNYVYSLIDTPEGYGINTEVLAGVGYSKVIVGFNNRGSKPDMVTDNWLRAEVTNSPFAFLSDEENKTLWIGTYGRNNGLIQIKKTDNGFESHNFVCNRKEGCISSNNVRSLLKDDRGNLWIGTDNGLSLFTVDEQKKENPKFVVFRKDDANPNSINHNYILPLFQSKNGTVWVGTMGGGLNKVIYNEDHEKISFEAITVEDGLPNNVIKGILEDDYGFLWISSNKGLTRYDVKDKLYVNYGISDGLQDFEFGELACCELDDGEMLFGGVNGFNAFYPKDIVSNMSTPQLALTEFHILNRLVAPGDIINGREVLKNVVNHTDKIRLKYAENSFSIYFSSLHYSAPAKNTYKYMLEGFDTEWVRKDATDRIAKYTNLPPGKYTFKVLASNNDGIWTDDPKVLEIVITPPWYLSIFAWLVYVILFLLTLWFFQRFSLIRIKQKNELLMEHFEKEKVQELSQMKLRFFTNISHEFRTPLTLIIGPLEKLITKGNALPEKKVAESYAIMHRNASILLRLINQLIDFRKFEQGKMILRASNTNIVDFLGEVFLSFSELANNKNIDYNFNTRRKDIQVWFDDDKLERIMYNLLSNAFKFTREGGSIDLVVDEDDYNVIIKVIDTGVGIPENMQKHIFERFYQADRIKNRKVGSTGIGLSFIKGLVEMQKGEITFESKEDEGTSFTVLLKKGNAHFEESQMRAITREVDTSIKNYSFLEPVKVSEEEPNECKSKQKVLVVEDNFELSSFVKDSLSDCYEIYTAENGKEGLEKVPQLNPDVIVSDIMMPVMNGFDLCEKIKSSEEISHIPVILLTAKSTAENRIKGYKLGADGYISKPFSIEVLQARIQNLIDSREKLRSKFKGTISIEPSEVTTTSMDEKFMQRILKIVEENISNSEFTVEQLARDYGMSQIVMNKKLKGLTGMTAKAFIRNIRLKRAAQLFATGKYSVTDVTYEVGFSDLKYFRNCFKDEFGLAPSEYMKKHKTEEK